MKKITGDGNTTITIWAPLVNGEQWLRDLPPMKGIEGPFSSGYGGLLYATISKRDALAAHKRARGENRTLIKEICKL